MTSRDHMLGHAPAAQFDDDPPDLDWLGWATCTAYPLGIPNRQLRKYQIAREPSKPLLLPMLDRCTQGDHDGISRRPEGSGIRLKNAVAELAMHVDAMRARRTWPTIGVDFGEADS